MKRLHVSPRILEFNSVNLLSCKTVLSQLSLCAFVRSESLSQLLTQFLRHERYFLDFVTSDQTLIERIEQHQRQVDCLILEEVADVLTVFNHLHDQVALLPAILLQSPPAIDDSQSAPSELVLEQSEQPSASNQTADLEQLKTVYHRAIIWVPYSQIQHIEDQIQQAIGQFLQLPATQLLPESKQEFAKGATRQSSLVLQQRRLATKLKERLGYLGVYYKRNPQYFLRSMSRDERREFLKELSLKYREIVLGYFTNDDSLNQKIDEYVNTAFFADTSVSQIVEIHMELMDEFSKQLQLEGRSEEILLDYRLTLIDIIAHLCEMYRRSIPRDS